MDVRCPERLHFILDGDIAEVKCKSKRCGAGSGNVVLHRFDIHTGTLVETRHYKDPKVMFDSGLSEQARHHSTEVLFRPPNTQKEGHNGSLTGNTASVRSA